MATDREYRDYILEQLSQLEDITCRSMMGEYIIYYRGRIAAYICDNRLLAKPVKAATGLVDNVIMEPPYEGAKDMLLIEETDNREFLTELFNAMYEELPEPKKSPSKKKKI